LLCLNIIKNKLIIKMVLLFVYIRYNYNLIFLVYIIKISGFSHILVRPFKKRTKHEQYLMKWNVISVKLDKVIGSTKRTFIRIEMEK